MRFTLALSAPVMLLAGTMALAQPRAPSPDGLASTEVGGRDLWGSGETYGRWLYAGAPPPSPFPPGDRCPV